MYTRVFKPEEKYAWQALNLKKHIWFFFQNYELWLKYEIENFFYFLHFHRSRLRTKHLLKGH